MHGLKFFAIRPGGEDVVVEFCHSRENLSYLRGSLARRINHLRHTDPQGAVMVDFRETKIFKGKMAQAMNSLLR
jgi:hypothetical protein